MLGNQTPYKPHLASWGIGLFIGLYILAASLYPGGIRWADASQGFSIRDSYWCDLIAMTARNHVINPAQPYAWTAMLVLCSSLGLLWWNLPRQLRLKGTLKNTLQWGGVSSMIVTTGLVTEYHDTVIYLAGLLGLIALITTLYVLWTNAFMGLFISGICCAGLCLINFGIYATEIGLFALPLLQKGTFLSMLLWFMAINSARFFKNKNQPVQAYPSE